MILQEAYSHRLTVPPYGTALSSIIVKLHSYAQSP